MLPMAACPSFAPVKRKGNCGGYRHADGGSHTDPFQSHCSSPDDHCPDDERVGPLSPAPPEAQ